jgi:gluconolactonase
MKTLTPTITDVTDALSFPEGPVWLPDGAVLVTELGGGCIARVEPDGSKSRVSDNGGSPNGAAIGPDGALYVCNSGGYEFLDVGAMRIPTTELPADHSGGRIERVDLDTGTVTVLYTACDGNALIGPNDLVFDAHGGFWFTDHGRNEGRIHHLGGVYYAQPDGSSIREVLFPVESPNGIGLSADGTELYVAETHTGRLRAWTVTAPGEVGDVARFGGMGGRLLNGLAGMQLLDSLAVDAEGNVVVGTLVTGALSVIAPDGALLEQIMAGDPFVTNVCFGGPNLQTAYATCSATGRLVRFDYPRGGLRLEHAHY